MTIARLQVALGGNGLIGPGLMTFYSRNLVNSLPADVTAVMDANKTIFPTALTWTIPKGGDTIDEATGVLMGTWGTSGQTTGAGTNVNAFGLGNGARTEWHTAGVYSGRHVRGRTFWAPISNACYGTDGRLLASVVQQISDNNTYLISHSGGDLVVWCRPLPARPGKNKTLPARAGAAFPITSATVPSVPTALRSRRS